MDARRKRFVAAVVLFLVWVGILGVMAARSSKPPAARPRAVSAP